MKKFFDNFFVLISFVVALAISIVIMLFKKDYEGAMVCVPAFIGMIILTIIAKIGSDKNDRK